jgi:hypothetical protein
VFWSRSLLKIEKKMYKVVSCSKVHTQIKDDHLWAARQLRDEYGLGDFYSIGEVLAIWNEFSESYCAGWLGPDKEHVEMAFGVELEEIMLE